MLRVYFNYPNPRISVHADAACSVAQLERRNPNRVVSIVAATISDEIQRFARHEYRFRAEAGYNDMWLEIDFQNSEFEMAVFRYVHALLAGHYSPFRQATPSIHC